MTPNDGVVRLQALELECTPNDIRRLLRRREWVRVFPGVYVDHTGPLTWRQRAWAAVLHAWPAALCHSTAISADDGPGRRTFDESAPLHVAAGADDDFAAIEVLANAVQSRRTTAPRIRAVLDDRSRIARREFLASVLSDIAEGACSVLEHGYLTGVERPHGLPTAERQVGASVRGPVYRDVTYAAQSFVVELDGRLGAGLPASVSHSRAHRAAAPAQWVGRCAHPLPRL